MSHTSIKARIKQQIWVRAGGRCEYRGCNRPLWKDELTLAEMNAGYLAHIISDSPDGPRGDPILSERLKTDFSNIMLLCDTHHRMIDREQVEQHPVVLLREFKRVHEERIQRLTGLQEDRRTHILLFGTRIGDRQGAVNYRQACEAVLPERYPVDERGIRLDLARVEVDEQDPEFWNITQNHIKRGLAWYLEGGLGPNGEQINHLSVFALAPIYILIYFGQQLGDIVTADIYQRHRNPNGWEWRQAAKGNLNYLRECFNQGTNATTRVAVNLSLSGVIELSEIYQLMGEESTVYTLRIAQPYRDFLQSKEQLELFKTEWYSLLAEIRQQHGGDCEVHLFPAIPNSVAVEIGRSLLSKADPHIVIYDKRKSGFERTITL